MKLIVTSLLMGSALFAQSLTYSVKAPLFGTIGKVNVNYSVGGGRYDITASMHTSGFAKKLSGNRKEHYHSYGRVVGNIYKAKHFKQEASYKDKRTLLEYIFNYPAKTITKIRKKWKANKVLEDKNRALNYFTYNDLFSVYHNIVVQLKGKVPGTYSVQVAGLESNGGNLVIKVPSIKQQQKEARSLGVSNVWVFHIITHKKIMKSKNGEIIFAVGDDGIAKAVRVLNTAYVSHIDAILN
jgi:hypothetical protein